MFWLSKLSRILPILSRSASDIVSKTHRSSSSKMSFSLLNFNAIGFDVDHTLCRYKVDAQIEVAYQAMAKYLVKVKGYSEKLLNPVKEHASLCFGGGLVFDVEHGHFLKFNSNGMISKASYGLRYLSDQEIQKYYREKRWKHFKHLQEGSTSVPGVYHFYDNNFDISGIVLLSRMIEYSKNGKKKNVSIVKHCGKAVWNDCIAAVEQIWNPTRFEAETSDYFNAVREEPEKYLVRCSISLKQWITSLKDAGIFVFIITSSDCHYANHILKYCFGEDWSSYFDLFICKAEKPRFFTQRNPFLSVDPGTMQKHSDVPELERGHWYSGGNATDLMAALQNFTKIENPKIVYFGDSLRSDIIPTKLHFDWDTVYIMEELGVQGNNIITKEKEMDLVDSSAIESWLLSDSWGAILSKDHTSFYAHEIKRRATIAAYSLDYFTDKPLGYMYETLSPNDHLRGYYPDLPSVLYK